MNNLPQTYESVVQQRDELQKKLLAYEQAAKNSALWLRHEDENHAPDITTDPDVSREWISRGLRVTKLHTAPVLPKQPESRNEIMAKGVEAFAKDWKGSARYSRISEMACNFAAKLRNGDADEC